jgi:hypothetical protein
MKAIHVSIRQKGYPKGIISNVIISNGINIFNCLELKYQFGKGNTEQRVIIKQEDIPALKKSIDSLLRLQEKHRIAEKKSTIKKIRSSKKRVMRNYSNEELIKKAKSYEGFVSFPLDRVIFYKLK